MHGGTIHDSSRVRNVLKCHGSGRVGSGGFQTLSRVGSGQPYPTKADLTREVRPDPVNSPRTNKPPRNQFLSVLKQRSRAHGGVTSCPAREALTPCFMRSGAIVSDAGFYFWHQNRVPIWVVFLYRTASIKSLSHITNYEASLVIAQKNKEHIYKLTKYVIARFTLKSIAGTRGRPTIPGQTW